MTKNEPYVDDEQDPVSAQRLSRDGLTAEVQRLKNSNRLLTAEVIRLQAKLRRDSVNA